jgi:hypothetical protein
MNIFDIETSMKIRNVLCGFARFCDGNISEKVCGAQMEIQHQRISAK